MPVIMKYVMFDDMVDNTGIHDNVSIIFPSFLIHKEMAKTITGMPVSAGFVRIVKGSKQDEVRAECYGRSESLGLRSREKDSVIITRYLTGVGY